MHQIITAINRVNNADKIYKTTMSNIKMRVCLT